MQCYIVDSFTSEPFQGNPAGVCLVEAPLSEDHMLRVAAELNLSETAFLIQGEDPDTFSIRYFSPKKEIPLCGHATLASAKVLSGSHDLRVMRFINAQGLELVTRVSSRGIEMTFPSYSVRAAEAPARLLEALGLASVLNAAFNQETGILLLELAHTRVLAEIRPDFEALYRSHDGIEGVLVTAASKGEGYDYHCRYFWPWSGTNEDPVTGGTQTFLAPYWSERLKKKEMRCFQSSHRTGSMEVEVASDQVLIRGQAVVVLEGRMLGSLEAKQRHTDEPNASE